ncbi:MAG: hypothetical protein HKP48_11365 [Winogradskyella sp.]|uniref:hypothetical protein n=1 Tax=Winogradskyella sp. TaxID=1883156 RepID=UPI001803E8AA|nr:hypothetical protein [Winogradskyella sp.]MBT8243623.1 hypothetical protein [Winogradskyella sp.]NNK23857.1 hypothetical protein [Winogradskyella sp.]
MKNLLLVFTICLATSMFAQQKDLKRNITSEKVKVETFKIAVEVDSVEEIESTFSVDEFREILNETEDNENIIFSIKCNDRKIGDEVKSHIKYEINGNTNEKEKFIESVRKVRAAAIKYYNTKR